MPVSVTVAGTTYQYPAEGDTYRWGPDATLAIVALTEKTLQLTGGAFTLTADANFGANFGLISAYFKSRTANIADAGILRLARADSVVWRNEANNGNLVLEVNSSNELLFDGNKIIYPSGGIVTVPEGGTGIASYTAGDILYATGSTTLAKLGIGSTNEVLLVTAGAPAWGLIVNDSITDATIANAKLANMATQTIKGRTTAGSGAPEDLTATQATAILDVMVGDSGSGGTKGLVPAPTTGDATKVLSGAATWVDALTDPTTTEGDILYRDSGGAIERLGIGSSGQALTSDGSIPQWATIAQVPTGASLPFWGETAPSGFLLCDGSAVSRTTYAALFSVLGVACGQGDGLNTFNVPDTRGRFMRFWDDAAGRDPDAASRTAMATGGAAGDNIGSIQSFAIQSHGHNLGYPARSGANGPASGGSSGPIAAIHDGTDQPTATKNSGVAETRPLNFYCNMIIKT